METFLLSLKIQGYLPQSTKALHIVLILKTRYTHTHSHTVKRPCQYASAIHNA